MTIDIKNIASVLLVSLVIWYFLTRTSLGSAYFRDMRKIPQFFTSFIGVSIPAIRESYSRGEVFRG
jgi:branched-subunit amino acid ABC-type transport system permease component